MDVSEVYLSVPARLIAWTAFFLAVAGALPAQESPAARETPDRQEAAESKADPKTYLIGPEDVLLVRVWREPELSGSVTVRPDGRITMQLLREIQAEEKTPEQLAEEIRKGLEEKFLKNPQVTVTVVEIRSKKYCLQGEVGRPGAHPLLNPTTVLEALVNAGGFREFANQKGIIVMRKGERFKFNYKDVIRGKKMEQNILLEPGDIIIVP